MFEFLSLHIHFGFTLYVCITFRNVFDTEPAFLHYIVIDESYRELRHASGKLTNKIHSTLDGPKEICLH